MFLKAVILIKVCETVLAVDGCTTPNGDPGDCIVIHNCSSLVNFFKGGPISPSTAAFLRKFSCGFEGQTPKVCCPISTVIQLKNRDNFASTDPISSDFLPEICGVNTQSRIYGGEEAQFDEFPWMAQLRYRTATGARRFFCGGALISKRYVLTAAHCVSNQVLGQNPLCVIWIQLSVRLGEHNILTNPDCLRTRFGEECADPHVDVEVEKQIVHENYNSNTCDNDIALLRLKRDIQFTDFIRPICLPLNSTYNKEKYVGQKLWVAGWGDTEDHRTRISNVKLKVKLPVTDFSECREKYYTVSNGRYNLKNQICAGGERGKDSCRGDSGGPLMTVIRNGDALWYSIGIVSLGSKNCGSANLPGVYTNVAFYVRWIVDKLQA